MRFYSIKFSTINGLLTSVRTAAWFLFPFQEAPATIVIPPVDLTRRFRPAIALCQRGKPAPQARRSRRRIIKRAHPSSHRTLLATLTAVTALVASERAYSQMIPLQDLRVTAADVTFLGETQSFNEYPPAPFAYFQSFVNPFVNNPDPEGPGFCEATAQQISQFFPAGISMSGSTSGGWQILPGDYSALSAAKFDFRVDTCIEYQLDTTLLPGDLGESRVDVSVPGANLSYQKIEAGALHVTGRLPAGTYFVEGHSYIISNLENVSEPTYSVIWTCHPVITTLIAVHPKGLAVTCGGTVGDTRQG